MKIIALQGKSNTGKTTTLKLLIKNILNNNKFKLDSRYTKNDILDKCKVDNGDVKCVFECDGIKIGITTRGDTEKALERDFKNHFSECDIVICAIHTHGKTVKFIDLIDDSAIVHSKWFVKPEINERIDEVNAIQSDYFLREIQSLIEVLMK